jgi:raffinose/stachyose/melibiose transport system substrate-binding protein
VASMLIGRQTARRTLATLGFAAIIVTGCATPGAVATPTPAPTTAPTTAPSTAPADSSAPAVSASPVATVPDCGTDPITLSAYVETISQLVPKLSEEFTKQYPNVTWDIKLDTFANGSANLPRLLASDNPPDIARAAMLIDLAKDNLLKDMTPYEKAYGWDKWPQAQFEQVRINDQFKRGTGPIRAFGLNQSAVGVFYNKDLAAKIGMTAAPKTVEEFDALLAKAKEAGLQPIMQWNAATSGGGLAFPLQNLMAAYGDNSVINDWVFLKDGANIDTPEFVQAAQKLDEWIKKGYFPSDVNAIEYTDAAGRFGKGEGVFTFNGDWQNGGYDKDLPGKVGFFTFPENVGMSAPLTFVVGEKSKHADCAAFFLNWAVTNDKARAINVAVGGSNPGGPADAKVPEVSPDSVMAQTLAAGAGVTANSGGMDFIANATSGIFFQSWTPELQKLVGGKTTPEQLLKDVQAFWVKDQ